MISIYECCPPSWEALAVSLKIQGRKLTREGRKEGMNERMNEQTNKQETNKQSYIISILSSVA